MRAVISQLLQLIVLQSLMLLAQLPGVATLVCSPEPEPEKAVYAGAHAHHAERDGVAADEARFISRRAATTWLEKRTRYMATKARIETYYIKADMIPDMLPKVSCRPVAVVLLPYRGALLGNCFDMFSCRSYDGDRKDSGLPKRLEDRQRRIARPQRGSTRNSALQVTSQTAGRHIQQHL